MVTAKDSIDLIKWTSTSYTFTYDESPLTRLFVRNHWRDGAATFNHLVDIGVSILPASDPTISYTNYHGLPHGLRGLASCPLRLLAVYLRFIRYRFEMISRQVRKFQRQELDDDYPNAILTLTYLYHIVKV